MKGSFHIQTNRLYLREMSVQDAPELYALNADAQVLQYTGDSPFQSVKEAENFLTNYNDYARNGMGRWAVIRKKDEAFLGWCGLKKHPDGMIDLGFRLHRKFWGKGYATEAAQACLSYGLSNLGLTEIVGRVAKENKASIRVLEKIGMRFWKEDKCEGIENALYYRIP